MTCTYCHDDACAVDYTLRDDPEVRVTVPAARGEAHVYDGGERVVLTVEDRVAGVEGILALDPNQARALAAVLVEWVENPGEPLTGGTR